MNPNPPPHPPHLLSLPYEIRMQIWHNAIPTNTDLRCCPCLTQPPRKSDLEICGCHQDSARAALQSLASRDNLPPADIAPLEQPPSLLLGLEELLSELPLTCKQIFEDTKTINQPQKHLTLCSPTCMTSLLSPVIPHQLATIATITIAIDLRIFRPPPSSGLLASFHDIWRCIYNTRIASDRAIRRLFPSPAVERMKADIIEPALDFYLLEILVGRPFDCQEIAYRRYWSDPSKGEERVAELRRIVGNRSREGLPVPGRWRVVS